MSRKKRNKQHDNTTSSNSSHKTIYINRVKPKTKNQREFIKAIHNNDLIFCIGPAGSGKTHLSVGVAVDLYHTKQIDKIIITRPIIEAGQKHGKSVIGYLPGDINAKMYPFLRPIHDELGKFIGLDAINNMKKNGVLEICPLEHMRGRTFERSIILADEAQNITEEQMDMLVTRLGIGSKMIIIGDIEQSDLPNNLSGGLENFADDLDNLEGVAIMELEAQDIQRHHLVKLILERRKLIKEQLSRPASWKEEVYDSRQDKQHSPKNAGSERKHDANSSDSLDGFVQENIQGNKLS